jgi:hypothetical protein
MTRLTPREADVGALALLAKGRCTWPDCTTKIYALVDGRYVTDCMRAHIEAAETNGPRWRASMSDEERRAPDNLMWLCMKHHTAVDADVRKYTVAVLKRWKVERQNLDPAQAYADQLTSEDLQNMIDEAVERLVERFEELDLPGLEVAEMLVTASERMPNEDLAVLLHRAAYRMPDEGISTALLHASDHLPDEGIASMLIHAAGSFPNEAVALQLQDAADRMPDSTFLIDLERRLVEIRLAAEELDAAARRAAQVADSTDDEDHDCFRWQFFAGGAITVAVAVVAMAILIGTR